MGENLNKLHPEEVNFTEIMFYLEEMLEMDMIDEWEEDVYYDLLHNGRTSSKKLKYVKKRIRQWQNEKF